MDSKALEIINQMVTIFIYTAVLSREIAHQSLDLLNTTITVGGIAFSVIFMFFIWYFKKQKFVD